MSCRPAELRGLNGGHHCPGFLTGECHHCCYCYVKSPRFKELPTVVVALRNLRNGNILGGAGDI